MLTGQGKKDYQREYMREYMKKRRDVKTLLRPAVKTQLDPVRPKSVDTPTIAPNLPQRTLPFYNRYIHKAGDRVLVRQGGQVIEAIVPELDAEGNPMPQ